MNSLKLILHRLSKQNQQIERNPLQNIIVARKTEREFHFCIYGLQQPYKQGFYHGVLQLPQNYPFSAPKFKFFTQNGRFQVGKYVCTTFTSYHQEAWSASWTIRTLLTAIQSFFVSSQTGYGTLQQTKEKKSKIALSSLDKNLESPQFFQLFSQKLKRLEIKHPKLQSKKIQISLTVINESLNDEIQQNRENIASSMLQEQVILGRRNPQNANRFLKLLYGGLIALILALILLKF